MSTESEKSLEILNKIEELARVEGFINELADEWDLPLTMVFPLNLALEEALTNTISYGYDDDQPHTIRIDFSRKESILTIGITDDGHPYDPTAREDPDITLGVEERPIGGLGIFLIKKMMDTVEYQRIENKNRLIVTKKIES